MGEPLKRDRCVFIAGAETGISRAIALTLARSGWKIVLAGSSIKTDAFEDIFDVAQSVKTIGGEAISIELDFAQEKEIDAALQRASDQFGGIDVLINNAELTLFNQLLDLSSQDYDLIFEANCRRAFLCSKLSVPYLKERDNPHIVNISPPLDFSSQTWKEHHLFTASKMLMSMWTLSLSQELRRFGIGVNSVWPSETLINSSLIHLFVTESPDFIVKSPLSMAHAIEILIGMNAWTVNGQFFLDQGLLRTSLPANEEGTDPQKLADR